MPPYSMMNGGKAGGELILDGEVGEGKAMIGLRYGLKQRLIQESERRLKR